MLETRLDPQAEGFNHPDSQWSVSLPQATGFTHRVDTARAIFGLPPVGERANSTHTYDPALSADGRSIAFVSTSDRLTPDDNDRVADVFWGDTMRGTVRLVTGGVTAAADNAAISGDGRKVAFVTGQDFLVSGDSNGRTDVFVRDLGNGSLDWGSKPGSTFSATTNSGNPSLSFDGRLLAFDSGGKSYLKNTALDFPMLISGEPVGPISTSLPPGTKPELSDNGQSVVYSTNNGRAALFDLANAKVVVMEKTGALSNFTASSEASVSADGRYVLFDSKSLLSSEGKFLGSLGQNRAVYRYDNKLGTYQRVSENAEGFIGNGDSTVADASGGISADGRYALFVSKASNLVPGDSNGRTDLFIKDIATGAIVRIERTGWQATLSGDRLNVIEAWAPTI